MCETSVSDIRTIEIASVTELPPVIPTSVPPPLTPISVPNAVVPDVVQTNTEVQDNLNDSMEATANTFIDADNQPISLDDVEEELIQMVHDREPLWSMRHSDYKNRPANMALWDQISAALPGNFSWEEVRDKWKRIRESYSKSKTYMPSGSGATKKKPHKYEHQLKFVNDNIGHRKTTETSSTATLDSGVENIASCTYY